MRDEHTHYSVHYLFLKALGAIYAIAFVSFGLQITGLLGRGGILPADAFLHRASQTIGPTAWRFFQTLFWINASDAFLKLTCFAGLVCAVLVMLGRAQRIALALCYVLYLSLVAGGQDFMSYQWDMLLLECEFLAVFLGWHRYVTCLFRWLLFRLMFLSGVVKLTSGDPTWRNLTALLYHYQTQPLPTPLAWYVHQLPAWFHRFSVIMMFAVELAAPLLLFAPRRFRPGAALAIGLMQVVFMLTGNYTFFNLLAMALCLFALDDAMLDAWLPRRLWKHIRPQTPPRWAQTVAMVAASMLLVLSVAIVLSVVADITWGPTNRLVRLEAPFGIANSYGLFAVMTTTRDEIIVEGSNDGREWRAYEFKYKPGDVYRAPPWVAPHQPRLDWQMWFAALGSYRDNPWFLNFAVRLLQGSPEVLRLVAKNPFPGAPPKYIRAQVYRYWFTDWATRRKTGAWWNRSPRGVYLPPISLEDVRVEGI
jgi:lipase maturation factor 1